MNQGNDFQQFGFDHYDQTPHTTHQHIRRRSLGARIMNLALSPIGALAGVLLLGGAFTALVISVFFGEEAAAPPLVQAETTAFKIMPGESDVTDMELGESTIYSSMNDRESVETAPVESLLDGDDEDRLEAFYQQVEEIVEEDEIAQGGAVENLLEAEDEGEIAALEETAAPSDEGLEQVEEPAEAETAPEATASRVEPPQMGIVHKPGSNPETLEFVRSVLEKKDGMAAVRAEPTRDHTAAAAQEAASANNVQPAAGSQAAAGIKPGSHYVQLASVTSASGAVSEWGKLQSTFPAQLQGLDHRVSTADLGERGVYYRIQAGPMSKDSADALCAEIKAQKPGGCLVTK